MPDSRRRTIARAVALEGVGLHLGLDSRLTFRPAPENTGVVFRRTDMPSWPQVPAIVDNARTAERRTRLGVGDVELHTVEHVLAAVVAAEIDDVWIDVDGVEPPVLDGSAEPFWDALRDAGVAEGRQAAEYLDLAEPVRVIDGESVYEAHAAPELRLDVTIDFAHPLIGRQRGEFLITREAFARELAGARTFGFVSEVETLRAMGLIRGASTANAVVLDESEVVETSLRWPDEFLRHKAMDCLGDLALAGKRVRAQVTAFKPSHRGTVTLVREMVRRSRAEATQTANGVKAAVTREKRMAETMAKGMGVDELIKIIPHRYPFLMVDRILEIEERRIVGLKNVTINEPFFQGHFPGHPIMPGVLIIEAMAQVGGVLLMGAVDDYEGKVVYFMSLDNVKFRRPVKPGDQLRLELEIVQIRGRVCRMRGVAKVESEVVAEAEMAAMVRDK